MEGEDPGCRSRKARARKTFSNHGQNPPNSFVGRFRFGGKDSFWSHIGTLDQEEADRIVGRSVDSGINFIDTADVYSEGLSETILGNALKRLKIPRENVVIATKVLGETASGPNSRGLSRYHVLHAVKSSLSRLQLDHIDLYQVHGFDPATPVEETVEVLDDLVRQGLVRYVGVSNWSAWQIMKALGFAEKRGLARFESLQAYYSIAGRDLEREIVPMLESERLALLPWSPLAGGLLSGKFGREITSPAGTRRATFDFPPVNRDRAYDCIDAMRPMAERRGVLVARVAIAWLLHQPVVTSVVIGAKRIEQLDDNIAAASLRLDPEELAVLDRVSALPAEYPGWMFERQGEYRRRQLSGGD